MEMEKKKAVLFWIVVVSLSMAMTSLASLQQDEQECAEQLTNLAACIPFVSGTAKKPTAECCQDTQKLKATKPKCLCVLIKESTDPSMGLPVNTTLAVQMPFACNIDAKVSDCPSILNLPADSPDAKIFKEAAASDSTSTTTTTTSSSTDSPPASSSDSDSGSKGTTSSTNNGAKRKLPGGEMIGAFAAFIFFF